MVPVAAGMSATFTWQAIRACEAIENARRNSFPRVDGALNMLNAVRSLVR
jgi:hypothetical protein